MTTKTTTTTVYINHGDIVIDLFGNHTPNIVDNFIDLAEGTREYRGQNASGTESNPSYDEAIFHRIIAESMIQGDDPLGIGTGGPDYTFDDGVHPELQFDCLYLFAMASADRRSGCDANDSQFFVTVAPTSHLDGVHTIFGEVVDGTSRGVVDEIARVVIDHWDRPLESAVITSIDIEK